MGNENNYNLSLSSISFPSHNLSFREVETDPKAPLADEEEEEEMGDPIPVISYNNKQTPFSSFGDECFHFSLQNNVQAVLSLCAVVGAVMVAMGLASSEWVIAEEGNYWQGLYTSASNGFYSHEMNSNLTTQLTSLRLIHLLCRSRMGWKWERQWGRNC